jgi:hypothetical protein
VCHPAAPMSRLRSTLALAAVITVAAASPAAGAERQCDDLRWAGLANEVWVTAGPHMPTCRRARQVLRTFLRRDTPRAKVLGWTCDNGGYNGAVLASCSRGRYSLTAYDAGYGE